MSAVRVDFGYGEKPTTLDDLISGYARHFHTTLLHKPDYRLGQAVANYICYHFPEVMVGLFGTRLDTYYVDDAGRRVDLITHLCNEGLVDWA